MEAGGSPAPQHAWGCLRAARNADDGGGEETRAHAPDRHAQELKLLRQQSAQSLGDGLLARPQREPVHLGL